MGILPRGTALTLGSVDAHFRRDELALDLSDLRFVDAYGLVSLACAFRAARDAEPSLRVVPPRNGNTREHLATMGFRDFLKEYSCEGVLPDMSAADDSDVVVPLQSARDSGGAQKLSNLMWEQLHPLADPQVLTAVMEGVWEIVANALEHAGSDALIMGQIYRSKRGLPPDHDDRVQVAIGDTGRGILESLRESGLHRPLDDGEALDLALTYLVSSVNDRGRGQGLHSTMELVTEMRGKMVIRSGAARLAIEKHERSPQEVLPTRGVLVGLSLPLHPGS